MQKLDGKTMDIVGDNINKLKEIFPDVFSEGKIDFTKLQENLGEFVDTEQERYSFNWNGKQEAKLIAQTPSTGTLRPCKEDSKDWDTTKNLYIEGDNLEVLKLLQKSYHNKVKMIYIDPPYNTGKDFVYKDNFKDNIKNYMEQTGQLDTDGNKLTTNSDQSGRYHSNWLNMMYPRLKLARNLLKDDGVIFISIDDNETSNLRKLCDEIFGEDNFIANIIWEKRFTRSNNSKTFATLTEHILCYRKSNALSEIKEPRNEKSDSTYTNPDNDIRGVWTSVSYVNPATKEQRPNLSYNLKNPITGYSVSHPTNAWKYSQKTHLQHLEENRLYWGKEGNNTYPRLKRFLSEMNNGMVPVNFWTRQDAGTTDEASKNLESIMGLKVFDFPKPITLIMKAMRIAMKSEDIILDFFSGSATTAHATIKLNAEDGGNRKYICVQLPEETNNDSFPTICEIGKERIRRAGEKIKEDNSNKDLSNLDIGFKVFKLDSSNIKEWDSEHAKNNISQMMLDHVDNIKSDRTEEDILYELLLKHGLDLTTPIDEIEIDGKKIFNIGAGTLYICLASGVNNSIAERVLEEHKKWESPRVSVIFKDTGFINDVEKTNVIQTLKVAGITDVKSV
ncbi:MAG TPA: site-specific DNA-methyltransferase [Fusobacteriaceae bacterium]|nr:site-specific DNA-methyltransferase [Fusobacteriaceae bacterium]